MVNVILSGIKKRRSLGVRLIILILLAALLISGVMMSVGYQMYRNSIERGYIRLGQNLARVVRNMIDADSLDRYLSLGVTDLEYESNLWHMRNIMKENDVQEIYVVRLAGDKGWRFIYDVCDDDNVDSLELGYLDSFDENYPDFRNQVLGGLVAPIVSETKWGWLLSVYEPIHNGRGELVGYVGADFSMDDIADERRSYLLRLFIVTLLITVDFAVLYILMIRKTIIMPVNAMAKAAENYLALEDGDASSSIASLDIRTNDELQSLSEAMKFMDRKINLAFIYLKKTEDAAQATSRAKTAFLGQMSNELRIPMHSIMGMTRDLLYDVRNNEKVTRSLKHILASSQRLLTVLNDILEISNMESGKLLLSKAVFSLADVCRSLNDMTSLQCRAKSLTFFPDTDEVADITVWGDRIRLLQAVGVILRNAVKFTQLGGEVRFVAEVKEQTDENVRIRFTVSDTGKGISQCRRKMLFQTFAPREAGEVSDRYRGIGVKLSICQRIIEMMGGSITVESEPGKGSVFSIEIVFDKAEPAEIEKAPVVGQEVVSFSGKKILIVDDVSTNRSVARIALRGTGAAIIEAKDGRQALEIVTDMGGGIDLILMDVSMPDMDGYEAARAIRALEAEWARTIPIIALTAHAFQEDVDAALEAGMDFHLEKPLNPSILISTIERYL
jgi:signal transduction histidine kinase/CheY-like chemotaxis protein